MEPTRPVLVLNPGDDRTFADLAEQLVSDGHLTTDALQAALRKLFPAAVVRRRELSDEVGTVWYVYREGHWVSPGEARRGSGSELDRRQHHPRRARTGRGHATARGPHRGARGPHVGVPLGPQVGVQLGSQSEAPDIGSGAPNRGR